MSDDLLPEQPARSSPADNSITIPSVFLFGRPALKIFPRSKTRRYIIAATCQIPNPLLGKWMYKSRIVNESIRIAIPHLHIVITKKRAPECRLIFIYHNDFYHTHIDTLPSLSLLIKTHHPWRFINNITLPSSHHVYSRFWRNSCLQRLNHCHKNQMFKSRGFLWKRGKQPLQVNHVCA